MAFKLGSGRESGHEGNVSPKYLTVHFHLKYLLAIKRVRFCENSGLLYEKIYSRCPCFPFFPPTTPEVPGGNRNSMNEGSGKMFDFVKIFVALL